MSHILHVSTRSCWHELGNNKTTVFPRTLTVILIHVMHIHVHVYSQTCPYNPLRIAFMCQLHTGLLSPFEICLTLRLYKGKRENASTWEMPMQNCRHSLGRLGLQFAWELQTAILNCFVRITDGLSDVLSNCSKQLLAQCLRATCEKYVSLYPTFVFKNIFQRIKLPWSFFSCANARATSISTAVPLFGSVAPNDHAS